MNPSFNNAAQPKSLCFSSGPDPFGWFCGFCFFGGIPFDRRASRGPFVGEDLYGPLYPISVWGGPVFLWRALPDFFTVGPTQTPSVGKLTHPSNAKTAPKGGCGFDRDDFERRALYPVFLSSRRLPSWIFGPGHCPKQCFSRGCSMGQCPQKSDNTSLTKSLRMGRWVGYRFLFLFRYAVAWGHGAGQNQ